MTNLTKTNIILNFYKMVKLTKYIVFFSFKKTIYNGFTQACGYNRYKKKNAVLIYLDKLKFLICTKKKRFLMISQTKQIS